MMVKSDRYMYVQRFQSIYIIRAFCWFSLRALYLNSDALSLPRTPRFNTFTALRGVTFRVLTTCSKIRSQSRILQIHRVVATEQFEVRRQRRPRNIENFL
jgi:hypothetical protein